MSGVSAWILSIAGVCILSVVVDLILPSGKTNSHIKNVMTYVIVLVVLAPLPQLMQSDFSLEDVFGRTEFGLQYEYIYSLNQSKLDAMTNNINDGLEDAGILGVVVSVSANIFDKDMRVDAVYVDLYNIVITNPSENINIKSEIREIVLSVVDIKEDLIIFYE